MVRILLSLIIFLSLSSCGNNPEPDAANPVLSNSAQEEIWTDAANSASEFDSATSRLRITSTDLVLSNISETNSPLPTSNRRGYTLSKGKEFPANFTHNVFFVDGAITKSIKEVASVNGRPFCALSAAHVAKSADASEFFMTETILDLGTSPKIGVQPDSALKRSLEYVAMGVENLPGFVFYCGSYHYEFEPRTSYSLRRPITYADVAKALGGYAAIEIRNQETAE